MTKWIETKDALPAKSGIYVTHSTNKDRDYSSDELEDRVCYFFKENVGTGKSLWQAAIGFYDNGITHWLEVKSPTSK
jgi:hypothetical protein